MRGYPGTHDVNLAFNGLRKLKAKEDVLLPRYDKSKFQGLGDRKEQTEWTYVSHSLDIVIFEGWFLGFQPQVKITDLHLDEINHYLKNYLSLFDEFDDLIYLKPKSIEDIVNWRIEAEKNMKSLGKDGMSEQEIKKYIKMFVPAYELYRDSVIASIQYWVDSKRQLSEF
jgi:D-glycerate 3-kinase